MKLYAITTSESNSRPAKKGGNDNVYTLYTIGNKTIATVLLRRFIVNGVEMYRLTVNNPQGVSFTTYDKNGENVNI